jgi:hypothetical protein
VSSEQSGRFATWIPIVVAVLGLVAGSGWLQVYWQGQAQKDQEHERLVAEYLAPIKTLLADNEKIIERIREDHDAHGGVLESYVIRVNDKPPYPRLSIMAQDIATLASNNSEIMALLKSYSGYAKTPAFETSSARFRSHAVEWNNRWAAIPEVVTAGIQLPHAEPFPSEFPEALQAELEQRSR